MFYFIVLVCAVALLVGTSDIDEKYTMESAPLIGIGNIVENKNATIICSKQLYKANASLMISLEDTPKKPEKVDYFAFMVLDDIWEASAIGIFLFNRTFNKRRFRIFCTASYGDFPPRRTDLRVVVNVEPPLPDIVIIQKPSAGRTAIFKCDAHNNFPKVSLYWYLGQEKVKTENDYKTNDDLTVHITSTLARRFSWQENGANLSCVVPRPESKLVRSIVLNVTYAPIVSVPVKSHVIEWEALDFNMQCDIHGNPTPKVSWKKDSKDITKNDKYDTKQFGKSKYLYIKLPRPKMSGKYECFAVNNLGKASGFVSLKVKERVKILVKTIAVNQVIEVNIGDPVQMNCELDDHEDTVYIWKFEDKKLDETGNILSINVTLNDFGVYSCYSDYSRVIVKIHLMKPDIGPQVMTTSETTTAAVVPIILLLIAGILAFALWKKKKRSASLAPV